MTLWLNIFCIALVLFMLAHVSRIGLLSDIPTLFVFVAVGITIIRVLSYSHKKVAGPITGPFMFVTVMTVLFCCKHLVQSGSEGAVLALKILMYHMVFLAGLLLGYYELSDPLRKNGRYVGIIFILPLLFYILYAKIQPPSDALSIFNRNSFASLTITASALLLGFGAGRPLVSLPAYIAIVIFALIINTTLGALLTFLLAVVIFLGPKVILQKRFAAGSAVSAIVFIIAGAYFILTPDALPNIEVVKRMRFTSGLLSNLVSDFDGNWLELDMASVVIFAPSDELDMSAAFRLLHWIDILNIHASAGLEAILFGGGTNWIDRNESRFIYPLAAHSEYIRLSVEQGLVFALLVFTALFAAALTLQKNPLFIPLFANTLFLGSENLLNNFVPTSMYFFFFAYTFAAERRKRNVRGLAPPLSPLKLGSAKIPNLRLEPKNNENSSDQQ